MFERRIYTLFRESTKGRDFRGEDLERVDLRDCNLEGANFTGCDLRGADLRGAQLYKADFTGANLHGTIFDGADCQETVFLGAEIDCTSLRGTFLHKALFDRDMVFEFNPGPYALDSDYLGVTGQYILFKGWNTEPDAE